MSGNDSNISTTFGRRASGSYGIAHESVLVANKYPGLTVLPTGKVVYSNEYTQPVIDNNQPLSVGENQLVGMNARPLPKKPASFRDVADPEISGLIAQAYIAQEHLNDYILNNPTKTGELKRTFTVSATGPIEQSYTVTPTQDIG